MTGAWVHAGGAPRWHPAERVPQATASFPAGRDGTAVSAPMERAPRAPPTLVAQTPLPDLTSASAAGGTFEDGASRGVHGLPSTSTLGGTIQGGANRGGDDRDLPREQRPGVQEELALVDPDDHRDRAAPQALLQGGDRHVAGRE